MAAPRASKEVLQRKSPIRQHKHWVSVDVNKGVMDGVDLFVLHLPGNGDLCYKFEM